MTEIKDAWTMEDDDTVADKLTPMLIKMLALSDEVLKVSGDALDRGMSDACNIIDLQGRIIDALAAVRNYERKRMAEIKKNNEQGEAK